MKKTLITSILTGLVTIILVASTTTYANANEVNKSQDLATMAASMEELNLTRNLVQELSKIDNKFQTDGEGFITIDINAIIDMDVASKQQLSQIIDKHGINYVLKEIQEFAYSAKESSKIIDTVKGYADEFNSSRGSSQSFNQSKYNLVTFQNGYAIEYLTHMGITLGVSSNGFTSVLGSSFYITDFSAGGGYSNSSSDFYVTPRSCSYNVNYTVSFTFDVPLPGLPIPITYQKPAHDYMIVYSGK